MVFLVILIASFLLQMILPWWIIVIISFVTCGLIGKTAKLSLWQPFFAILLLWTGVALYKSLPNHNLLSSRVAEMFGLHAWWLILVVSVLLGGFVAAVSGYCGYQFRKAVLIKKTNP
ncbi:ABC-type multidrug transport system fused ATPase/permease subunit [Pedobacter cryoconitis]|uniref:ABC-type multidrug transport system fused ATPase/permease subunit n=1 Tax=Pedobacter cryoconitis TaxID=188932 RepID=A0A7W8ZST9_9SPHI|nr:hypothetical protein [Pedobacter cryoconitis]MBB5639335.1 ABC-type multidrug transport system fused ATPase/permease subunit [Pedobacter cryoconitis]